MKQHFSHWLAVFGLAGTGGLWPALALAEESGGGISAAAHLTQMIGGLVIVIIAIVVLGWILRRTQGGLSRGSQAIELVAVRSVGTRERLMLVQVGEEQVLIGVAPSGMRTLHTMREPVAVEEASTADFSSALRRAVSGRRETGGERS
ncbi:MULTISPECIES: flagellar biosynthetic protein FliO [unclassified Thioalkalivibrio]|uniref:flagellar biosynthetic protein FliO n=1 Tax=unclassified Thioalkalivibrio TaxID=2621013 RepID=UPI000476AB4B|nr:MULTISPECIES: flagellar biosynthetic protein FliO [unclassified Thioalkalivibrio]